MYHIQSSHTAPYTSHHTFFPSVSTHQVFHTAPYLFHTAGVTGRAHHKYEWFNLPPTSSQLRKIEVSLGTRADSARGSYSHMAQIGKVGGSQGRRLQATRLSSCILLDASQTLSEVQFSSDILGAIGSDGGAHRAELGHSHLQHSD